MKSYEDMLKKAIAEIPEGLESTDRFEIPKVQILVQGKNTIIQNFTQICDILRRKPLHLQKFLVKELAAAGVPFKNSLKLNSVIRKDKIEQKLEDYVNKFVLCNECGKPDTKLDRDERGIVRKKCSACGTITVIN